MPDTKSSAAAVVLAALGITLPVDQVAATIMLAMGGVYAVRAIMPDKERPPVLAVFGVTLFATVVALIVHDRVLPGVPPQAVAAGIGAASPWLAGPLLQWARSKIGKASQ